MNTLEIISQPPIPEHLIGEVQSKLAYVDEVICKAQISKDGQKIILEVNRPVDELLRQRVEEKIQRVVTTMTQGSFRPKVQVLEDNMSAPTLNTNDPMPELMQRGELHCEADGIFTLGPLVTRLVEFFEDNFIALAATFDAQPYRFPVLIPARYLERVNYFKAFPHSLTFATHLREDLDAIDHFAQSACCDEHGDLNQLPESFAKIQALLSPAVCYHLYFALADKPLPGGKMIATAVGPCFRYESINLTSLERLWNFTMWELIFVGEKDFVLENREASRKYMAKAFEDIGLAYRVETANDPFFVGEFRKQAAFQSAFQLKYEIRANLPFKNSTLAVGSYNYHQDFFGRHLNITLPDGSPVHTGCTAFGLERMAYAFLSQYGLDIQKWPQTVKDYFGE
ncbi:MAG: hypothetical protein JW908_10550 [Anaerolineales bacterium]|nr:hypothetical protein [Anaerolineales bacterium]